MAVTVAQSPLVLNAFAAQFQNNLVSADAVTWKKYDGEMNDRNGLTVVEQVAPRYNVYRTSSGVRDLSSGVQSTVFGSETFKATEVFSVDMGWGDFAKIRDVGSARESEALKSAATQLAEQIDAYILRTAVLASNNWTGTPGTSIDQYSEFMAGYTRLKDEGVDDSDLRAILSYADKEALADKITNLAALDDMATEVFREQFSGKIGSIPTMFTQQLPVLTVGSRAASGASLINGANQNVNYVSVANSTTNGNFLTQTIAIDGLTGSQTIKDGEVFTIAGVYAYDNRLGAARDNLQQFRVVGDHTASSGAIAALRVFPAIVVPGTGAGDNPAINTAHATVSAAPADNAAITFLGTASTGYRPRVILQKGAIQVNTLDLPTPMSDTHSRRSLTKIPASIRMWQTSDFNTGDHKVRFDISVTANVRDRRRIVRINGS